MTPPNHNTAERLDDYDEYETQDEMRQADDVELDEFESAQDFEEAPEPANHPYESGEYEQDDVEEMMLDEDEIEASRQTAAPASSGGGKKTTMLAGASLLVALAGVGVGGVAYMDAQQVRTDAGAAFDSVAESVGKLGNDSTELQVAVSKINDRVLEAEAAISGIDTGSIQDRIVDVQRQLNSVSLTVENDRQLSAQIFDQIQADLKSIEADYQTQISNLQKAAVSKPVAKVNKPVAKAVAPKEKTVDSVADARFVSADQWGYDENVVLKTSTGSWEMIQIGDQYKGWRLMNVDHDKGTATFYDGKSFIKVNKTRG